MLVYKEGITRDIAECDAKKWLDAGYVVVETKEQPEEKPKAKAKK